MSSPHVSSALTLPSITQTTTTTTTTTTITTTRTTTTTTITTTTTTTTTTIALINMNGMKNEIVMKGLRREMMKLHVEVLFVTETFMSAQKLRDIQKTFRDYDVFFRSRKEKERATVHEERWNIMYREE